MEDSFDLPKLTCVYLADLLLMGLWIRQAWVQRVWRIRRTPFDLPLIVFLLAAGLSACFSLDPRLSLFGAYKIYVFGVIPMAAFALLFWFTAQTANEALTRQVRTAAVAAAVGAAFYGFLQFTGSELFDRMPPSAGGRVWSSLGNPLYLGAVCMMAAALAGGWLFQRGQGSLWKAVGPALLLMAMVGGMALALSRSAWVGALTGAVILLAAHRRSLKQFVPLGIFLAGGILLTTLLPGVRARAADMFSLQEGSNAARVAGWKAGLSVWKTRPWAGAGPDTFFQAFRPHRSLDYVRATGAYVTQADAHNDVIQIAATMGLMGMAVWLWLLFIFSRNVLNVLADPLRAGFAAALVALLVQNQFNFSSVSTSAWAAVFAALMCAGGDTSERPLSAPLRGFLSLLLLASPLGVWAAWNPIRADTAYKKGVGLTRQGDVLRALPDYEKAVRLQERNELYQTELANAYRSLGTASADAGQKTRYFDQAWAVTDAETRRHPHNPDPWNNRGVAAMWMIQLAQKDLWKEAKGSFEQAVRLDPMFVDAWANLAKWEHLAGHLEEEKTMWRKVLEIDPNHPMANDVLKVDLQKENAN
jgi:O-antigen ligase